MILPLTARGRTVGLVSLFLGAERGPLDPNDLVTAREVAVRAGLALDNARLYRQQADLAEGLQRSLLTDPPEVEGLQLAVRYQPAAQAAAVGGDWYDAFRLPDGPTAIVIGDVVGHDVQAAAAMGQLRGMLRGIAHRPDADPATVLTRLDTAMEGLTVNTTATGVVALVDRDAHGADRLRWSNAGHPPPMLIRADGTVTALPNPSPDLLLGFDPSTQRLALELPPTRARRCCSTRTGSWSGGASRSTRGWHCCTTCWSSSPERASSWRLSATSCWPGCCPTSPRTTSRWSPYASTGEPPVAARRRSAPLKSPSGPFTQRDMPSWRLLR